MPTYDYQCDACGHQFEAFQSMKDDALRVCPSCNESALRRLISGGTGVIFKGSGFYVNDSKKNGSGSSSGVGTSSKTTDAGTERSEPAGSSSNSSTDVSASKGDSTKSEKKNDTKNEKKSA
ncbi:MAG: FmdB family zinc ribbon protein [Alkalispirochaeta sp.]